MDSCSSSPSHSFKDRLPSRHGGLVCTSRDLACRSSEKEGGDALPGSPDAGKISFRRSSFGFERVERNRDWKTERPQTPSAETGGGRLLSTRKTSDGYRHDVSEGVISSPRYGERDARASKGSQKKARDRDRGDRQRGSSSPECDWNSSRSPKGFALTRDAFRFSPKRSGAVDMDGSISRRSSGSEINHRRTSPLSPKDKDRIIASPSKRFGKDRSDDIDASVQKTRCRAVKDEEKNSSSCDTDTRSCSLSSRSRVGRGDAIKQEQWHESSRARVGRGDAIKQELWHESTRAHEDTWRERSPALPFSHISKKVRSDRDRGRREDGKGVSRSSSRTDFVLSEASTENDKILEEGSTGKGNFLRNQDVAAEPADTKHVDKMEAECPVTNKWADSDMEEGELEPESHTVETAIEPVNPSLTKQRSAEIKENEECSEGKEVGGGMGSVVTKGEKLSGDHAHSSEDKVDQTCDNRFLNTSPPDKRPSNDIDNLQFMGHGTPSELGESSKGGLTLDFLDTREEAKSWTSNATEKKGHDSNRDLMLSLFTKPGVAGESTELGGDGEAMVAEQNGKQVESDNNPELSMSMGRPRLGQSGEESSQHSSHEQKKLKMEESLQLSLALPGTCMMVHVGQPDPQGPLVGPERSAQSLDRAQPERSAQSLDRARTQTQNFSQSQTYTNSDGFTSSFSFSQSQSFIHNPSCSLNCTSVENQELSCGGTRQMSQGTEQMSNRSWPALSGNEHTVTSVSHDKSKNRRGIPLYQRILQNGNIPQGFPSVSGSNRSSGSNHISQRSHHFGQRFQDTPKILDSSLQDLEVSGRQASTHKDIMERVRQQKAWFASRQQALSGERKSSEPNPSQGRNRLVDPSPPSNVKGPPSAVKENLVVDSSASSDRIGLHEITTEPVAVMAQKLQELPDSFLEGLKGVAKGVLGSFEKREEFMVLQENIRKRTDLTEESLLRAHRTQLEILVALKTGMQAYVQEGSKPQTYKALIEIFLQTKCRNIACQQSLPVFGCECKVCSKKAGFCHECMCVVCFKFDTEFDTCRWVGCDVCLHWCHTDCGLRMSYIAPTSSAGGSEMQYHCVACDHKSQLVGFIKDVFQKCAESWGAETLAKELDCVRRIFHGSEDMRGKQLCWKAEQMLQKLENKVSAAEVCRSMLRFFNEGNTELDGVCGPLQKSASLKSNAGSAKVAELAKESMPKTSSSGGGGGKLVDLEKVHAVLPNFDRGLEEKRTEVVELQYNRVRKRAEIEDIESVVRMKQAEVKMFQARADEARQEAGGLQRIIAVKQEKIDEDYACKYAKLRLNEAEERQQKWLEELRALENAQQEFQKMKVRMEAEIKELMMKMEMAKRQFA